jgi:hypothetical protein
VKFQSQVFRYINIFAMEGSLFNVLITLYEQGQARYHDLIILGNTFEERKVSNVRSYPKFTFGLIPICDSVSLRLGVRRFGLVPEHQNEIRSHSDAPK